MISLRTAFRTPFRIAWTELRRHSGGIVPRLVLVALVLVPLLYAALYLYADDDNAQIDELPAAVVNRDAGDLGRAVTNALVASGDFQVQPTGPREANEGIRDGDFTYAVSIPRDFSENLRRAGSSEPRPATLTLTTDGADSYLSHPIATRLSAAIRHTVAQRAGTDVANQFLVGFATIHGATERAAADARQLATSADRLSQSQSDLADSTGQLARGSTRLATGLTTLRGSVDSLPSHTRGIADAANTVANGQTRIAGAGSELATASTELRSALGDTGGQLTQRLRSGGLSRSEIQHVLNTFADLREPVDAASDRVRRVTAELGTLAESSRRVAQGARQLAQATPRLKEGIAQSSDGANEVAGGLARLSESQNSAVDSTRQLAQGTQTLRDGLDESLRHTPGSTRTGEVPPNAIPKPVAITPADSAAAATFDAGLAPFVIAMATWVGALVLFLLLRPLSPRALTANVRPHRIAFGGWLPPAALGVAQVVVLYTAVTWPAGVDVANPLGALGFVVLTALAFTAIVHALIALFGRAGLLSALALFALQLASAGGLTPGQGVPDVLYPFHVLLPMGHAIDGLRHLLHSDTPGPATTGALVLLTYLIGALAASVLAARRRRMWTARQLV